MVISIGLHALSPAHVKQGTRAAGYVPHQKLGRYQALPFSLHRRPNDQGMHDARTPRAAATTTANEAPADTWRTSPSGKQAEDSDATNVSTIITSFFDFLNQRNLKGLFALMAEELTYTNTGLQVTYAGKSAVSTFYVDVISSIPKGSRLVLDNVTVSSAPEPPELFTGRHIPGTRRASVEWHLEIGGVPVPGADGVGLYRVDTSRRVIVELRDRPQAPLQMLLPALAIASPAINLVTPVVVPALNVIKSAGAARLAKAARDSVNESDNTSEGAARGSMFQAPFEAAINVASSVTDTALGVADTITGFLPSWATSMYGIPKSARGPAAGWETAVTSASGTSVVPDGDSPPARRGASPDLKFDPARERPVQANNAIPMRPLGAVKVEGNSFRAEGKPAKPEAGASNSTKPAAGVDSVNAKEGELQVKASVQTKSVELQETGELIPASYVDLPVSNELIDISGLWEKDASQTQPKALEGLMDVLQLTGLKRMTARLIEGVEIKQAADTFTVSFVTVVPFFKVTEAVRYDKPVNLMRRDLRPGFQTAIAVKVPGGVRVAYDWGEPLAGSLEEEYVWLADPEAAAKPGSPAGVLRVTARASVGGKTAVATQIYRRTGKTRDQLLKESKARNSSLDSVVQRQRKQFGDKAV